MNRTKRLFDTDSHLFDFEAVVLSVAGEGNYLSVVLDATAFFPEGGGQYADPGTLAGCPVVDVQDVSGVIVHKVDVSAVGGTHPFSEGARVRGVVDRETRLIRMRNHSGEHIVSGIIHRRFGFSNVGFHLGDGDVTLDFNGVLTRAQIDEIEDEANRVVAACLPIRAEYPSSEELAKMAYRAKLDLTENVRIVEVGYPEALVDRCACCAPHVTNTGEIGLIKLLDFIHYKGGIRIHMLCGSWALSDYRRRYTETATVAAALSVKQTDVLTGFERMQRELEAKKQTIAALRGKLQDLTVASIPETQGSICYFDEEADGQEMRRLLNRLKTKCGRLCGVFVGNDEAGYRFVIGRGDSSIDLKAHAKELSAALLASGGGSSEMQQGHAQATRAVIEAYFAKL